MVFHGFQCRLLDPTQVTINLQVLLEAKADPTIVDAQGLVPARHLSFRSTTKGPWLFRVYVGDKQVTNRPWS